MKKIAIHTCLWSFVLFSIACTPEVDKKKFGGSFFSGQASFKTYLACGSSYSSGFQANELYSFGQRTSFSAILAEQFKVVGGGRFSQALMFDQLGFGKRVKLGRINDCKGLELLTRVPFGGTPDSRNTQKLISGPFNDITVPGLKVDEFNQLGLAQQNAYYARFASNTFSSSVADEAQLIEATFFTLMLGDADILEFAANGADVSGNNRLILPSEASFLSEYETTLRKLISRGANGAVVSIPDIAEVPFFKQNKYDDLILTAQEAAQLNVFYVLNSNVNFKEGRNAFVIRDGVTVRQMLSSEKVSFNLNTDSVKCSSYGSFFPLANKDVLTETEINQINQSANAYNLIIKSMAEKYNLAFFDLNQFLKKLAASGLLIDGVKYTNAYLTGGFFAIDALFPTPRGHAIIANQLINAINIKFNSSIPLVDINQFPIVELP